MGLSNYDRAHMQEIIADKEGKHYEWFTAHVVRFIDKVWYKADSQNRNILRLAFPDVVDAYEAYNVESIPDEDFDKLMRGD